VQVPRRWRCGGDDDAQAALCHYRGYSRGGIFRLPFGHRRSWWRPRQGDATRGQRSGGDL